MKKVKFIFGMLLMAALFAVPFTACDEEEEPKPVPDASFSFVATGNGLTVEFTNESTDATTYLWDFGDGTTSTDENPVHTFPDFGDYIIKLTATGEGGENTFQYTITVTKTSPVKLDDASVAATEMMLGLYDARLAPAGMGLGTPRAAGRRGSHLAFTHPDGLALSRWLRAEGGVVADFRPPNLLRFAVSPLYTTFTEAWDAVDALASALESGAYRGFAPGGRVT